MRIVIISPNDIEYGGGGEYWIFNIARLLALRGDKVEIITHRHNPVGKDIGLTKKLSKLGVKHIRVDYIRTYYGSTIMHPKHIPLIYRRLGQSDVAYILSTPPCDLYYYIILHRSNLIRKIIYGYHAFPDVRRTFDRAYVKYIMRFFVRSVGAIHVLNHYTYRLMINLNPKYKHRIHYIPNGVDPELFRFDRDANSGETSIILYCGSFEF